MLRMNLANFHRITLCAAVAVVTLGVLAGPLRAQDDPRAVRLSWRAVTGASGYIIQIRDDRENVVENQRTTGTAVVVRLNPGKYEQRLAALNRLGTPGPFTDWRGLSVKSTRTPLVGAIVPQGQPEADGSRVIVISGKHFTEDTKIYLQVPGNSRQEIDVDQSSENRIVVRLRPSQIPDGQYNILVQNPRGLQKSRPESVAVVNRKIEIPEAARRQPEELADQETEIDSGGDPDDPDERDPGNAGSLASLVPGLPAFQRGDNGTGGLWAGAFSGMILASMAEYEAATVRRRNFERNPLYQYFNNPAIFTTTITVGRIGAVTVAGAGLYYLREQADVERTYSIRQRNQVFLGTAATLTWGAHFYWENRDRWRASHLVPGMSHFHRGQNLRGALWLGGIATTGVLAASEYQNSQLQFNAIDSNTMGRVFSNPVLAFGTASAIGAGLNSAAIVYGNAESQLARKQSSAEQTRRNASYLTAVFAALYFGQIVDATIGGGPAVPAAHVLPAESDSYYDTAGAPDSGEFTKIGTLYVENGDVFARAREGQEDVQEIRFDVLRY